MKSLTTVLLIVTAALILSGCSTAYQKQGFSGGFDESQLAPNVWKISFRGNAKTTKSKAEEFTLLRSADLTIQNGFEYFVLADSSSDSSYSSYTTPTSSTTTFNANTQGNNISGIANTNTYGGQTMHFSKPSTSNTVVMHKEKPEVQGMIYDARFICNSLGAKYQVQCGALK